MTITGLEDAHSSRRSQICEENRVCILETQEAKEVSRRMWY